MDACFICTQPIDDRNGERGYGYTRDEVSDPGTANWRPLPGAVDKPFHRDCAEDRGQALGLHEA